MSGAEDMLAGQVALITGGGTGIGRGIAEAFASAGCTVVVVGRRTAPLEDFVAKAGGRGDMIAMDVGDEAAREQAIATIIERHGRLDLLVNNALAVYHRPFGEMTAKQVDITYRILLTAPTRLTQLALPHLIASENGRVINISSVAGRHIGATQGLAPYAAAKAGVNQLTRALAAELGEHGIRVNAIAPGATRSGSQAATSEAIFAASVAQTPLGRMGEPEDIANVALFLASPAGGWVTGQVIDASGGFGISG